MQACQDLLLALANPPSTHEPLSIPSAARSSPLTMTSSLVLSSHCDPIALRDMYGFPSRSPTPISTLGHTRQVHSGSHWLRKVAVLREVPRYQRLSNIPQLMGI